jgi:hypothetical protein
MRVAASFWLMLVLVGVCAAQDTNFPIGPQYLITANSTLFLRPIATPSLSFETSPVVVPRAAAEGVPASSVVETPPPLPPNHPDLAQIYWGDRAKPKVSEIEISGGTVPQNVPFSLLDVGVTALVDVSTPHKEHGESLADTASFWKAHKGRVSHVYTNSDIQRLHGG